MKQTTDRRTVTTSEDFTQYSFGVKASGMTHIMGILRNQLYSDKVLAVIREYSTNAADAMTEAKRGDQPFEVTLPNRLDMNFKVRDFGRGMSEEEIADIYCNYGESTRRKSNDYTGMLGIGSKSGFAYGDNFLITSFYQGKKTVYNAYLDKAKVGAIAKMAEEDTKDPDGMEIVVPVRQEDIDAFVDKAVKLYRHFRVKPVLKGIDPVPSLDRGVQILIEGNGWRTYQERITSVAIMGNIAYPLSWDSLYSKLNDNARQLLQQGIEIEFSIGELCIAASREALEYNDHTIKSIARKMEGILKEIEANAQSRIATAKTVLEARKVWSELPAFLRKPLTWNGIEIKSPYFDVNNGKFCIYSYGKNRYDTIKKKVCDSFGSDKETLIYNMDLIRGAKMRIEYLFSQHQGLKHVIGVLATSQEAKDDFEKQTNIKLSDLPLLSAVPKWVDPDRPMRSVSTRTKGTLFKFNATMVETELNQHHRLKYSDKKPSDFWEPVDELPDEAIYVRIEMFRAVVDSNTKSVEEFYYYLNNFKKKYKVSFDVYGVKEKGIAELEEDCQTLKDYYTEVMQDYVDGKNLPDELEKYESGWSDFGSFVHGMHKKVALPANSPFSNTVTKLRDAHSRAAKNEELINELEGLQENFPNLKIPRIVTYSCDAEIAQLRKLYPLFEYVRDICYKKDVGPVFEYITLMDASRSLKDAQNSLANQNKTDKVAE